MIKKSQIKAGNILVDDCSMMYKVLEVFKNSAIVESYPNEGDYASEIMSFEAMNNEGWRVAKEMIIPKTSRCPNGCREKRVHFHTYQGKTELVTFGKK